MTAAATRQVTKSDAETERGVGMRRTVPPAHRISNYRRQDPVARTVAEDLCLKNPESAHQVLYGRDSCVKRTVIGIHAFIKHREFERLDHWLRDLRVAISEVAAAEYSVELVRDCRLADIEDDLAQAEYQFAPTDANAARLVTKIDRTIAWLMRLRTALVKKHQLRDS